MSYTKCEATNLNCKYVWPCMCNDHFRSRTSLDVKALFIGLRHMTFRQASRYLIYFIHFSCISSMAGSLGALASCTWQDFMAWKLDYLPEKTKTVINKILCRYELKWDNTQANFENRLIVPSHEPQHFNFVAPPPPPPPCTLVFKILSEWIIQSTFHFWFSRLAKPWNMSNFGVCTPTPSYKYII